MSRVNAWTQKQTNILIREYSTIRDIRLLCDKLKKSHAAIKSRAGVLKLKRSAPNPNIYSTTATEADDRFIKRNYLKMGVKTMANKIGRSDTLIRTRMKQLNLQQPRELIDQIKKDYRIKKGHIPLNKGKKQKDYMSRAAINRTKATRFKKGEPNHNLLYDGCITVRYNHRQRNAKPHKYIRISKGVWKELQIYNWEKKFGPVPKGKLLGCIDGDTLNCKPSNWKLLTRAENCVNNSASKRLTDGYVAFCIVGRNRMHLYEEVLKDKKLLEIKRNQILLKRSIDEQDSNTGKAAKHERKNV